MPAKLDPTDLLGSKIGKLTILESLGKKKRHYRYKVQCDCGLTKIVRRDFLKKDPDSCSCGCKINPQNIVGKKFGMLLVKSYVGRRFSETTKFYRYKVLCDCGRLFEIDRRALLFIKRRNCGCLNNQPISHQEPTNRILDRIERQAKNRKITCTITLSYIQDLYKKQNGHCALSGVKLHFGEGKNYKGKTASLDRISSKVGYKEGNCQWVHKTVNKMKNTLEDEDFIEWCSKIAKHNTKDRKSFGYP